MSPVPPPSFDLPCLTADLPGVGGRIKVDPGDFRVDEIPAYLPCGSGEHLFLHLEKTGLTTDQMTRELARTWRLKPFEIGVAALKDRHAITTQWISVPARCANELELLAHPQMRLLAADKHTNKLRTGHLRGNRFEIMVRDVTAEQLPIAQAVAARLLASGVPNYYGEQRFGHDGETWSLGYDLLQGTRTPRDIAPGQRRFLLRLALSAVQSHLFNQVLAGRLLRDQLQRVWEGDVLQVVASGGIFHCTETAVDQARMEQREIVPTGPMFGPQMKAPAGAVADFEAEILAQSGLVAADFERYPELTAGTRRALLLWLDELDVSHETDGLRLRMTLPPGAYATVVLREFMKLAE